MLVHIDMTDYVRKALPREGPMLSLEETQNWKLLVIDGKNVSFNGERQVDMDFYKKVIKHLI